MNWIVTLVVLVVAVFPGAAQQKLLIHMDMGQTDHLKAYGIAYWSLTKGVEVDWLLNYRGGSFMTDYHEFIAAECRIRGVGFSAIGGGEAARIYAEVPSSLHPAAAMSVESHLRKLAREGRVRETVEVGRPSGWDLG